MAELKGQIKFLRGLNTQRGRAVIGYMAAAPQEYTAQITAAEVQQEVSEIESRIDDLQDRLDTHNAGTFIDLEA